MRCQAKYSFVFVLIFSLSFLLYPLAEAKEAQVANGSNLLQFKSGGHILGFASDRMYIVGMGYALIEEFIGANKVNPLSEGTEREGTGKEQAPPFKGVSYKDLWKGVTLKYVPAKKGMAESIFVIESGGDVNSIRLRYNTEVMVQKDGTLRFKHPTKKGYFSQSPPTAWQEVQGKKKKIEVAFKDHGDKTIGFSVGKYDRERPLIIDPTYEWHTFYGSSDDDWGLGTVVDGSGNLYVTGLSDQSWQGDNNANPLHPYSGGRDIFVLQLNSEGIYQWHTFYGSSGDDAGNSITVDGSDNLYVTGYSDQSWQGDSNADPLHPYGGGTEIFVLKLSTEGVYQWHTFYGSSGDDWSRGIAVDGSDNLYVTGWSTLSWQGDNNANPLHPYSGGTEIFVLKLSTEGVYQWHTFYGSSGDDYGSSIAVDSSGNLNVTGYSNQSWLGDNNAGPLHPFGGYYDILVLKLSTAGVYQWHTFYGSSNDWGQSIVVDGSCNLYVTGYSDQSWQGDNNASPLHAYSGKNEIFVLKLNSGGMYQWHTFYGSPGEDYGYSIAIDGSGNLYVTGDSDQSWQGDNNADPLHPYGGDRDIFVFQLNSEGIYQWHTFYGSSGTDYGLGIAVDGSGNLYVTGISTVSWQGDNNADPLHAFSPSMDIFVLKLSPFSTLSVSKAGTGSGDITAAGCALIWSNGIGSCTVSDETTVSLSAMADSNSVFTGWSGDCSGTSSPLDVLMDGNKTCIATFTLKTYAITVNSNSGGSVTPGTTTVNYGSNLTININPNTGYHIVDVQIDSVSQGAITSYVFSTITAIHTVNVTFAINTYTISASTNTGGLISPPGVTTVNYGGSQQYTITPNNYYGIQDVQVDGISVGAVSQYTFSNVMTSHTIGVTFVLTNIAVTSPNGGESWVTGSQQTITWIYQGKIGNYVKIELLESGAVVATLSTKTSVGSKGKGSYSWTITQEPASDYQIRVTSTTNAAYSDTSNGTFWIVSPPPLITVTSPNGGESWAVGTTQTIRWQYANNPGSIVTIDLYNGGVFNTNIASNISIGSNGTGSYSWSIPSTQTTNSNYTVVITSNLGYADSSNGSFSITPPPPPAGITVTVPDGGEVWSRGTTQTIKWTYTGNPGTNVKIDLYKAGVLSKTLTTSTSIGSGGNGSFKWKIPAKQATGTDYKIVITSTINTTYTDASNNNFTIN